MYAIQQLYEFIQCMNSLIGLHTTQIHKIVLYIVATVKYAIEQEYEFIQYMNSHIRNINYGNSLVCHKIEISC
jgi:hypothetical protein